MSSQQIIDLLKLVWPLILIQLAVQIYALVDILRTKKTKNLSVPVWILIIIVGEILGPILYFLAGKAEE